MPKKEAEAKIAEVIPEEKAPEGDKLPSIEELQTQIKELQETSRKLDENWKNEQRISSKKEDKNQQLEQLLMQNQSQTNMNKAILAYLSQNTGQSVQDFEETFEKKQPDLLKMYDEMEKKAEAKRQQDSANQRFYEIQRRTNSLGLDFSDEDYQDIKDFTEAGHFDKADRRLQKLEATKKEVKPPAEKVPTNKEEFEKLITDRARQLLADQKLLVQDAGGASGTTGKARKPSLEELQASHPYDTKKKIDSGVWDL